MLCPVQLVFVLVQLGTGLVAVETFPLRRAGSVGAAAAPLSLPREGRFCWEGAFEVSSVNGHVISQTICAFQTI